MICRSVWCVGLLSAVVLVAGCSSGSKKKAPVAVKQKCVAATNCFACPDEATLLEALELRTKDHDAFTRMKTSSKIIPVKADRQIKVLEVHKDRNTARVQLVGDPDEVWTRLDWLKQ